MKAELVKREDHWALYNEDGHKIAATIPGCNSKLSIKNCEAIANGYDLDELAFTSIKGYDNPIYISAAFIHFKEGFQKALEILSDKKFSEEDVINAFHTGRLYQGREGDTTIDDYFKSLQQTEWDVEIVLEYIGKCHGNNDNGCFQDSPGHDCGCFEKKPKLDSNGCLILKRI